MANDLAEQVAGVGALAEPARRILYLYVGSQPDAVSREEAAAAVDLPLHSVKFHLDRLVDEGRPSAGLVKIAQRTGAAVLAGFEVNEWLKGHGGRPPAYFVPQGELRGLP